MAIPKTPDPLVQLGHIPPQSETPAESSVAPCLGGEKMQLQFAEFCAAHPPRQLRIGDACWEYIVCGSGPTTLLLLPGAMGEAATSFQYCLAFAHSYRVISVSYPARVAELAALADGLVLLLDAEGVAQAHVVGGSYSGMVAQLLVRRSPARVAALVLAQAGVPRRWRAWAARLGLLLALLPLPLLRMLMRLGIYGFLPAATPEHAFWRAYFRKMIASLQRHDISSRLRVAIDFDRGPDLAPIDPAAWNKPMLIIEAERDLFFAAAERRALRCLYPQAQIYSFPHGHSASVDRPEDSIRAIATFLSAQ